MKEENRDSHRVRARLNSGFGGERIEEHSIQRGIRDWNKNIDYHLENLFDIPSQPPDALIVGLSFMSLYFFAASAITELLLKHPDALKVVLLLLFILVVIPIFFSFYAISRNIKLIWGVLFRALFATTGILFGFGVI